MRLIDYVFLSSAYSINKVVFKTITATRKIKKLKRVEKKVLLNRLVCCFFRHGSSS